MLHGFVNSNDCKPKKVFPFKPASLTDTDAWRRAPRRARGAALLPSRERASCSWAPLCHVIF